MKKRCRFCGDMIDSNDLECKHCGKVLSTKSTSEPDGGGVVRLDSWQQKSIPAWVMYLAVGICLLCIGIMYAQGCDRNEDFREDAAQQESADESPADR